MSQVIDPNIHESWKQHLFDEFQQPYFHALRSFLKTEKQQDQEVFPSGERIFAAFDTTPFDAVKVVIIGQDPYHGPGQANGLCFSVNPDVDVPPSLKNIFKEIHSDLELPIPDHGDLTSWAEQGVLLLNATLTVRARTAGSHQKKGWESFTDSVIHLIDEQHSGVVFLLWGNYAKKKAEFINTERHHVLSSAHPSPLAASKGFFGCKHFSQANDLLTAQGKDPIDWAI